MFLLYECLNPVPYFLKTIPVCETALPSLASLILQMIVNAVLYGHILCGALYLLKITQKRYFKAHINTTYLC